MKTEAINHLRGKLIPFWEGLRDEQYGGFYGYLGYDLTLDKQSWKGSILNSRILYFFSRAYQLLGDANLLDDAKHAYAFFDRLLDKENGGVYWSCEYDGTPRDTMKHTYAQSFAIYGLSMYAIATGEREPVEQALALYRLIEGRMADKPGYREAFDRTFTRELDNAKLSDNPKLCAKGLVAEKTMNTLLHVMEAYTLLYRASGDADVKESLCGLLRVVREMVYNESANRLEVFFDRDLRTLIDMQSYGHDIEATWLLDFAADTVLEGEARRAYRAWTTSLAWAVYDRAYRDGSLLNEIVEGAADPTRIWWVQAETVIGMTNLYQKTGDERALKAAQSTLAFIWAKLVDPRAGSEWFAATDADGKPCEKPIVEPWKCPYHNGRMCMELIERL